MIAWPLLAAGLLALLWAAYTLGHRSGSSHIVSAGPRVEEVRRIAKLAVLRVQVADVIEGRNAGAMAVVLVKGDCDIAVDLSGIEISDKDESARTAALVIPAPRPDRPRVDQSRTKIYELRKTGLALLNPFADPQQVLLLDCMREAQQDVEAAVQSEDYVARAKEQAERLLTGFYQDLGWTVAVRWK
jgi:hypothetical protein